MDVVDGVAEGMKRKHADTLEIMKWAVVAEYNFHRIGMHPLDPGIRDDICAKFNISKASMNRFVGEWESQRNEVVVPDLSVKREGICGAGNLLLTEENTSTIEVQYSKIIQLCLTCLWKMCEQRRTRAASPMAISQRQIGQVLSWPRRRCELSTTTSGRVSMIASVAPCEA
jgi:hypothetical protein